MAKVGRNAACPCGSGRKYKKCHGATNVISAAQDRLARRALTDLMLRDARFRFTYLIPHPEQDLEDATPFQLYTPGVLATAHLVHSICQWPADIRELSAHPSDRLTFRVLRHIEPRIIPIEFPALARLCELGLGPFIVVVTTVAFRAGVREILNELGIPTLHVSEEPEGTILGLEQLTADHLRDYAKDALHEYRERRPTDGFGQMAAEVLDQDLDRTQFAAACADYRHGLTAPNEIALQAFGYRRGASDPIEGKPRHAYVDALIDSARAVTNARSTLLNANLSDEILNRYVLTVSSPAWVFGSSIPDFHRIRDKRVRAVLRAVWNDIKRQREFLAHVALPAYAAPDDPGLKLMFMHRRTEMFAYTAALAAFAARDLTPVIRLEPKVNGIRARLIQIGGCARGRSPHRDFKVQKLFALLLEEMRALIEPKTLECIEEPSNRIEGIKLISDLPLEFLPIRGSLLTLRYDCSRLPVTPGSMSFGETLWSRQLVLARESFAEVLVIRSFANDDPCRTLLETAVHQTSGKMSTHLSFRFVDVATPSELVAAINSYEGSIVVFDCHGQRSVDDHSGTIVIGGAPIHLYQYRTQMQVPPIALFSACDTFPMDGSHSSSASGMLIIGARAVVGTLLPVNAVVEANFIARLAWRIAEFLPLAVRMSPHGVNWRSFFSGMLRMAHVTEVLVSLESRGIITTEDRDALQFHANQEINVGNPMWVESVEDRIGHAMGGSAHGALNCLTDALAHVQLGHPESLLIVEQLPGEIVSDTLKLKREAV